MFLPAWSPPTPTPSAVAVRLSGSFGDAMIKASATPPTARTDLVRVCLVVEPLRCLLVVYPFADVVVNVDQCEPSPALD